MLGIACGAARVCRTLATAVLRRVPRVGPHAARVLDITLPDAVLGPLLAARVLL